MHVVLDFIPNHTGRQHPWFLESMNSSMHTNAKRNWYVWEDSPDNINNVDPPNNWVNQFNSVQVSSSQCNASQFHFSLVQFNFSLVQFNSFQFYSIQQFNKFLEHIY
jgi:glycosidase